ncbi:hypothetical protein [Coxiella burnetii]|uniref:Uncharacterized protein n=1 Tax=Coxiella burnetii (strain RSA 493 / Nine Mile phase I) TaxID=227377 RepID=Q83C22_COXBU|nr:hypothetical protein [Coxiella burnetii]NP_820304.1 hypothetical protein CBU_1313 [Coxiella burnetii RSA 493]AAO90818.1 hypothetical protein CBU_1313 [Coxiella burnetii RSA 493]ABX77718.1 hypothetical protein COXBURSA331_A1464 [Coxiella burnetii RSA 331]ACJ18098.1 hypothetical protein CbuG_0697 [Coxiella burnetii CbuG_Q212]ACJ20367.1 hypothetical protein CbuK_1176 [Coxiella burnetii CbuK_Q154]AML48820.1 hypothetical protein AUR58_06265 [Coxiella burnetii]
MVVKGGLLLIGVLKNGTLVGKIKEKVSMERSLKFALKQNSN